MSDSGAAAVEFALVLPVLILILGAIVDFGFIFAQQIALNNATRDAARAGVVAPLDGDPLTCSGITTAAKNSMGGGVGMNPNAVSITVNRCAPPPSDFPCTGAAAGTPLEVRATYASTPPIPVPFMSAITLNSTGVFQCEYS